MRQMITLALKDLKLMVRVKPALFFALGWPLCMSILFGLMFGGGQTGRARLPIAVVNEDRSAKAEQFTTAIVEREGFDVLRTDRTQATDLVRHGRRSAAIVILDGFGAAQGHLFSGKPPALELLVDPSHKMEAGMLQSLLYELEGQEIMGVMKRTIANTAGAGAIDASWRPLSVAVQEVSAAQDGPRSSYEVSFVQGLVWGLIGCAMTFALSLVTERTHGTFVRLLMAPLSAAQVLGGKAIACFVALMLMQSLLLGLGVFGFGIHVGSPVALILVMTCASLAFVGIMMFVASLGRNEQATSGAGWALLMPMSLFGGGMVPLFAMPAWMTPISNVSPIKWAVLGLEGAIWRGFTMTDFLLPCGILLAVGALGFTLGTVSLRRRVL